MNNIKQSHILSQLSFLIGSHLTLLESVLVLKQKARSKKEKNLFEEWANDLECGVSFSACISKSSTRWNTSVPYIISAGETTGTLKESVIYASHELKKHHELKQKIIGALLYPLCIAVAMIGVTSMIVLYILPNLLPLFESLGAELPFSTKIVLFVYHFMSTYGWYAVCVMGIFCGACWYAYNTFSKVRIFVEHILFRVPLLRNMLVYHEMTRMFRMVSVFLSHEVSLDRVFEHVALSSEFHLYASLYIQCRDAVLRGERVSIFLASSFLVPDLAVSMYGVGESSGSAKETSLYISHYYERELDDVIKKMSSLIEPVLMVCLGVLVGFIAISVISPIYEITQSIKK